MKVLFQKSEKNSIVSYTLLAENYPHQKYLISNKFFKKMTYLPCHHQIFQHITLRELQSFLPKMTRSVISAHILALVSMRKYILNHK